MLPVKSFWTTAKAGLPKSPARVSNRRIKVQSAIHTSSRVQSCTWCPADTRDDRYDTENIALRTKDLDEVLGGLAERSSVHTCLGDGDIDKVLVHSAVCASQGA